MEIIKLQTNLINDVWEILEYQKENSNGPSDQKVNSSSGKTVQCRDRVDRVETKLEKMEGEK